MAKSNNNANGVQLSEFDFRIKIGHHDSKSFKLRDEIYKKVSEEMDYHKINTRKLENPFQEYLRTLGEKHLAFNSEGRFYISDYYEREGSLIISFTLLLVNYAVAYSTLRLAVDNIASDINKIIYENDLKPAHVDVFESVRVEKPSLADEISTPKVENPSPLPRWVNLTILTLFLGSLFIPDINLSDQQNIFGTTNKLNQEKVQIMIQEEVEEELQKAKIDYLIQLVQNNGIDSAIVIKKQNLQPKGN